MHVKIYVENGQKSPKTRCGTYAYLLECELHGEPYTLHDFASKTGSRYQMDLSACVDALSRMKKPSEIEIIGDLEWVATQSTYLPQWESNGWKNAVGNPIKNLELWQQFHEKTKVHKITFAHCKNHAFSAWMGRGMKEYEERLAVPEAAREEKTKKT